MNKKLIWIIVILVVLIGTLIGLKKAGIIGKEEGIKVATEKVTLRTITETVNASGKVYPEVEVKVSPDVSGEVVELNVNEGDTVRRGQVVAKIYADILASQRDQVSALVNQAQAQYANAQANINGFKATYEQTKAAYDRQQKLFNEKVISRAEFEQSMQAYQSASANYTAAKEGLKSSEAQIKSAQAQLTRAEKDMTRTVIVAPMDGVVSLLGIKKGERVAGNSFNVGTEMMRIADMRSIEVRVDVGENDIPKVKIGDTALVDVDAYNNRKFKGVVYKIANPSNQSVTATATEVTNYKVHIRLLESSYKDLIIPGKSFPFRPNMSASADIQTKTKTNVLSIALNAVTTRNKNSDKAPQTGKDEKKDNNNAANNEEEKTNSDDIDEVVFVVKKDGTIKKVKVSTAIQDLNYIEVLSGLQLNEEVVIAPYSVVSKTLKEGDKVKVVEKEKLYEGDKKN
ncbi:MAG: efflux RND transporter periplasmic adaptor subunit [Chitinophagaceae bacterium]